MNVNNLIIALNELAKSKRNTSTNVRLGGDIVGEALSNAQNTYALFDHSSETLLFHYSQPTWFSVGKEGFLITDKRIYINMNNQKQSFSIVDANRIEILNEKLNLDDTKFNIEKEYRININNQQIKLDKINFVDFLIVDAVLKAIYKREVFDKKDLEDMFFPERKNDLLRSVTERTKINDLGILTKLALTSASDEAFYKNTDLAFYTTHRVIFADKLRYAKYDNIKEVNSISLKWKEFGKAKHMPHTPHLTKNPWINLLAGLGMNYVEEQRKENTFDIYVSLSGFESIYLRDNILGKDVV